MKDKKEYMREYWIKNKKRLSIQRSKYYKEHKEEIDERNKVWLENNRDKWNAYMRERRRKAKLDKQKNA